MLLDRPRSWLETYISYIRHTKYVIICSIVVYLYGLLCACMPCPQSSLLDQNRLLVCVRLSHSFVGNVSLNIGHVRSLDLFWGRWGGLRLVAADCCCLLPWVFSV